VRQGQEDLGLVSWGRAAAEAARTIRSRPTRMSTHLPISARPLTHAAPCFRPLRPVPALDRASTAGDIGVRLSKDLTSVAAQALMTNLTRLGPLVLTPTEKLLFAVNFIKEKIYGRDKSNPYVPNFKASVKHICIHSGGRAVIDGMQKVLRMDDAETEPSRATLYKWGNVSSSSVWYVLSFIESFKGLARGDRVWQLSFGSGFKCNSAIWVANRKIKSVHPCWEGFDIENMRAELADLGKLLAEERAARKAAAAEGRSLPRDD
jgi:hypothetical protein